MLIQHSQEEGLDPNLVKRLHAKILYWLGYFNMYLMLDLAIEQLDQSENMIDQLLEMGLEAREEKCLVLFHQGMAYYVRGDLKKSRARFEAGLALSREIGVPWMVLRSLMLLGDVARNSGSPSEAKQWYAQCLAEAKTQGNRWGEIRSLSALGWAARSLIAYQEAQGYYEESLKLAKMSDNPWEIAHTLESSGFLALFLGDFDQALARLEESVQISKELGMPYRTLPSRVHIGIVQWLSGEFASAETVIRESLDISQELEAGARLFPNICLAEILAIRGRYREANDQIRFLKSATQSIFLDRFTHGRMTRTFGWVALAEKRYADARIEFEKSIELYQKNADDEQIAWSQAGLANAAMHQGNWDEAHQLLIEALWTCIEIQGFIPLLFTLPMVCLYLEKENPEQACQVYAPIQHSPFLADAPLFRDIVYQYLPEEIVKSTSRLEAAPQDLDSRQILWSAASSVLTAWMQVWTKESEVVDE